MMEGSTTATQQPLTAVIVGTGFGGIGMAIKLRQAGITDFVMLEKSDQIGGTWRDNTYPGAACDVRRRCVRSRLSRILTGRAFIRASRTFTATSSTASPSTS